MFLGNSFKNIGPKTHKGENGTVIIIGGSEMYTGAPIFSALAALKTGSDLAYIFTHENSVSQIKKLLEAVVLPFRFVPEILEKATTCIIGPGLGKINDSDLKILLNILEFLDSKNVPFIIDGDAIHYYKKGVFSNLGTVILTPNHNEAKNLFPNFNHICIYKGKLDRIEFKDSKTFVFNESSMKRCGGQGDLLTGILATALSHCSGNFIDACISSCEMIREASRCAFELKEYSLMTSDIIDVLPTILRKMREK